jgi:hypothetical protein
MVYFDSSDNLGESLIYLWVEYLREYLAKRDSNQNIPTDDSPSKLPSKTPQQDNQSKSPSQTSPRDSPNNTPHVNHRITSVNPEQLEGDQSEEDYTKEFNPALIEGMASCGVMPDEDKDPGSYQVHL